ncbi:MAG: CoA ester lyase [Bacilli bacterium]|nr:CoA ester lyase [Bacilli bacterium]
MRRSLLFIPSNNPGMVQNANLFGADAAIFDLEDAVSVQEKDSARNLLRESLDTISGLEKIVRINGMDTPYFDADLKMLIKTTADTIMLPKAGIQEVQKLDLLLTKANSPIRILPIIELAASLLEVEAIAVLPRVDGLLLGAEDLTSDLEVERTVEGVEIAYARSKMSLACKGARIDAIDTPCTNTTSDEEVKMDALRAKQLGMNAKACIHPNQVAIVNTVFSPSHLQIKQAKRIIEAAKSAQGAFSLDGKMIDKPIIERSKKILEKAKRFNMEDHDE